MKKSKKLITRLIQFFLKKFFINSLYSKYLFYKTKKKFNKSINAHKSHDKFSDNLDKINHFEYKITSQNNEDGIIEFIFKQIPNNKYFVEIGFSFYEFNTLNLIKDKWDGKLIDVDVDEAIALKKNLDYFFPSNKIEVINNKVTKKNIQDLVYKNAPNNEIDFFSLDIDSNDYWVLKEINLEQIKVICCEYNHWLGNNEKITINYDENFIFKDNGVWGASLLAMTDLLKIKNFSLIAVESSGTNAFFVNNKFSDKFEILSPEKSYRSVGRFYNKIKKKEIFQNVKNNYNLLKKV